MSVSVTGGRRRLLAAALAGCLGISLIACSSANKKKSATPPATPPPPPTLAATTVTVTATATALRTPFPTISLPGLQIATPTPGASSTATGTGTPSSSATAAASPGASGTASPQGLARLALQTSDLPSGFALTDSGPGGAELGRDVVSSYEQEFQQRDVTSTQALQQTIVIIDLIGQYRDAESAKTGVQSVNQQSLNQLLGTASITAEPATVPAIGEDPAGYHFSGTTGGSSVGGYLIVFHRGPIAALVVTAAVKGAENLPQTISLAQRQDQKIQSGG
jgi:hypothetical protein